MFIDLIKSGVLDLILVLLWSFQVEGFFLLNLIKGSL
jgi:hypothetical protein